MSRLTATTSAETIARYFAERGAARSGDRKPRRAGRATPAYATDGIAIPRRKRRVLLDLAPDTANALLRCVRRHSDQARDEDGWLERLFVDALEKAR